MISNNYFTFQRTKIEDDFYSLISYSRFPFVDQDVGQNYFRLQPYFYLKTLLRVGNWTSEKPNDSLKKLAPSPPDRPQQLTAASLIHPQTTSFIFPF